MTTEPEEEREDAGFEEEAQTELLPDVMSSPVGQIYFGYNADTFLEHWLAKLGVEDVAGAALLWDENGGLRILHPSTGELLEITEIAKRAGRQTVRTMK